MNVIDLGRIEYGAALEIQNRHVEDLLAGGQAGGLFRFGHVRDVGAPP